MLDILLVPVVNTRLAAVALDTMFSGANGGSPLPKLPPCLGQEDCSEALTGRHEGELAAGRVVLGSLWRRNDAGVRDG